MGFGPLHWPWDDGLQPPCFVRKTCPSPCGRASVEGCPSPAAQCNPEWKEGTCQGSTRPVHLSAPQAGAPHPRRDPAISATPVGTITLSANPMNLCALCRVTMDSGPPHRAATFSVPSVLSPLQSQPSCGLLPASASFSPLS